MNAREYRVQRDAARAELGRIKDVIARFVAVDSRMQYSEFKAETLSPGETRVSGCVGPDW